MAYHDGRAVAALKSREIVWLAEVTEDVADAISAAFGQPNRMPAAEEPAAVESEPWPRTARPPRERDCVQVAPFASARRRGFHGP